MRIKILGIVFGLGIIWLGYLMMNVWPDKGEPFTYDQARDLLEIRLLAEGKDIKLLGPTTSINGVHLGPAYYYLLLPGVWLGGGDPSAVLGWQTFIFIISLLLLLTWGVWKRDYASIWITAGVAAMPVAAKMSHYFWNAHFMLISLVWLILIIKVANFYNSKIWWVVLGVICGVNLQMESALGIIILPAVISHLVVLKKYQQSGWVIGGFILTLLPQMAYEATHDWQMSKLFIKEFVGSEQNILGQALPTWGELFRDRGEMLWRTFKNSFSLAPMLSLITASGLVIVSYWVKQKRNNSHAWMPLLIFLWAIGLYLIYPYELKWWYTYGLSAVMVWWVWETVGKIENRNLKFLSTVISLLLMVNAMVEINKFRSQATKISTENPSTLYNQIAVLEKVNFFCGDENYALYTYVPGIYDYSYQYLGWWLSKENIIKTPTLMSYEPNVPDYVPNGQELPWKVNGNEVKNVCVIIENGLGENYMAWEGRIREKCVVDAAKFEFGTRVEKRVVCD